MAYKIQTTELADADLDNIVEYHVKVLKAPAAATALLDEIESCYQNLSEHPMMYESCQNIRLKKEGYRKALVKNYLFAYKVFEDTGTVVIYRFFHASQDYEKKI